MITREEPLDIKKKDIEGTLNLALIMVNGEDDFNRLLGRVATTIDILQTIKGEIEAVDEFLEAQAKVFHSQ